MDVMPKVSQQHRDARREQILAAARRCFLRDGFHATSMQDLFAESGLSSGAVYSYFASKDDVIEAIAEENIRGVLSVGAPIRDRSGKMLAALSVAFPKYLDASQTLQSVTPLVTAAAQRISRAVGGTLS